MCLGLCKMAVVAVAPIVPLEPFGVLGYMGKNQTGFGIQEGEHLWIQEIWVSQLTTAPESWFSKDGKKVNFGYKQGMQYHVVRR